MATEKVRFVDCLSPSEYYCNPDKSDFAFSDASKIIGLIGVVEGVGLRLLSEIIPERLPEYIRAYDPLIYVGGGGLILYGLGVSGNYVSRRLGARKLRARRRLREIEDSNRSIWRKLEV